MTLIEKLEHEHDDRELTCQDLFEDGYFDDKKNRIAYAANWSDGGLTDCH